MKAIKITKYKIGSEVFYRDYIEGEKKYYCNTGTITALELGGGIINGKYVSIEDIGTEEEVKLLCK